MTFLKSVGVGSAIVTGSFLLVVGNAYAAAHLGPWMMLPVGLFAIGVWVFLLWDRKPRAKQ